MELTENQKKLLNNVDQKLRRARKEIDMVIKEESKSNKLRRQETADPDGCTKVQQS
jgi:hypothetical protein